ncbi:MAG: hypothetical protein AAGB24_06705 [Bacteroidota bacterium]
MPNPTDFKTFKDTLHLERPPSGWPLALQSLWWDAKGDWNASHDIAQDLHTEMGSWIHAYLHRKEGDEWNASYWYGQARKPFSKMTLDEELKDLVEFLLKHPLK